MAELRRHVEALRAVRLPELPPFCSGAVGYAGYDTVRYFERLPNAPPDDRQVPDLAFAFYDQMVVFDNVAKTIVVVAMARLDQPRRRRSSRPTTTPAGASMPWSSNWPRDSADLRPGRYPRRRRGATWTTARISPRSSSRKRCGSAWSTSAPATSSRSCSASGWKCRSRPIPSRSTARCGWSIPAPSCSTSARPA